MKPAVHPEDLGLMPKTEFSRREFVTASLATGFALAVLPDAQAEVISTPTDGLVAGEVQIPVLGGDMPAYRAMPQGTGPFPMVLVVQEIFGVHEHMRDVCRRLARAGYVAVAPELYARQGDVSKLSDINAIRAVVNQVPDAQVMDDLTKTVAWAAEHSAADAERLAITGFCWGGRITWLYSAHNPDVKAGVAWYGRLVGEPSVMTPKHPIDVVAQLHAPVLGLYGSADQGIPNDTVEKMRAALKAAGKPGEIILYPDAPHAFHADYRPSYRKEPAEDGWKRLLAWFKQHGV
ncbi:dienelactone hydrolase family protein [Chitinimonas taiwanensis]|uniref:Carboxymethylenebutenolidase n=1 Tax=Chitinimonas taiwanensis DSM 18899 TaxID=1121279 RepID=A0A1K2HGD0_9NEIS|nr:dienelactone hydrolase family protein [Chitinimonas taiwanensis]SFZ75757.1 carboxymethylenebutenolidase [Chitinimonas taiwanensis DSM 18899]